MLPADPIILCADQDADKDAICAKLTDVGYEYNASRNQFV